MEAEEISSREAEESSLQHDEGFVLYLIPLSRIPTMSFNQGSNITNSRWISIHQMAL